MASIPVNIWFELVSHAPSAVQIASQRTGSRWSAPCQSCVHGSPRGAQVVAAGGDQCLPPLAGGWLAVDPPGVGRVGGGCAGDEGGDVDVVGVLAAVGEVLQAGHRGGDLIVSFAQCVVEDRSEFENGFGDRYAGEADIGAQECCAVRDLVVGAGVADEFSDLNLGIS